MCRNGKDGKSERDGGSGRHGLHGRGGRANELGVNQLGCRIRRRCCGIRLRAGRYGGRAQSRGPQRAKAALGSFNGKDKTCCLDEPNQT
jgi:hypothetical protein